MTDPAKIERATGRPYNKAASDRHEWRFGRKGALCVSPADGVWYDHETGEGGTIARLLGQPYRSPRQKPAFAPKQKWGTKAETIWLESQPINGTLTQRYLEGRKCAQPTHDVRHHANLWHSHEHGNRPAMVSRITNFATGVPLSLHQTFLGSDARKVAFEPKKKLLRGHQKRGGVIRLCPDDEVTTGLGLAEGIETALAVMASGWLPVWAAVDAHNLANLPVLNGIGALTIFADQDEAGIRAAEALANRWHLAGREVAICAPVHGDWNG